MIKFIDIIKPHIPDCMKYKIEIQTTNNAELL
jgi:hypothetical protein